MTESLCNIRPVIYTCAAAVLDCRAVDGGYDVLLDKTVFFPEGGGQPSDTGTIGGCRVLHARQEGDEIWHLVDKPLAVGSVVETAFDAGRRRDHSVQHTGEHIFSGMASALYGAQNVGFHMAEDYLTVDLDLPLDAGQLEALEREANRIVWANIPVIIRQVDEAEYETVQLRKKAAGLKAPIRIVTIEGADSCTCCGTHCDSAGEVGLIRIASFSRYKGGVRVWIDCGERALTAVQSSRRALDAIARRLSVGNDGAPEAVVRQGDELAAMKHELKHRTTLLASYIASGLADAAEKCGKASLVLAMPDDLPASELRFVAERLCAAPDMTAVLFAIDGETLRYQLMRGERVAVSMRELCLAVNAAVNGKGGGNDRQAQGSGAVSAGFGETLEQLRAYLRAFLK